MAKGPKSKYPPPPEPAIAQTRADSWMSVVSELGTHYGDKRESAFFFDHQIDVQTLEDAYASFDVCARICDGLPESMFREGFSLKFPDDPKNSDALSAELLDQLEDLGAAQKCEEALALSRCVGGAVILMGIDDGQGDPSKPVNLENIKALHWLKVLGRGAIRPYTYYDDELNPKHGLPELYVIQNAADAGILDKNGEIAALEETFIHETRLVRVDGFPIPARKRAQRQGWGGSVLERCWKVVRDFDMSWASVGVLMQEIGLGVFKMQGLADAVRNPNGAGLITARYRMLDKGKSTARGVLLDTTEDYSRVAHNLTGIPNVLDSQIQRISMAARMPVVILAGISPAGMNATGEADLTIWYDYAKAEQLRSGKAMLTPIIQMLMLSDGSPTDGVEPDNWSIYWNQIWRPTDHELAQIQQLAANAHAIWIKEQVITPEEASNVFTKEGFRVDNIQLDEKTRKKVAAAYAALQDPAELGIQPHEVAPTISATETIRVGNPIDPNASESGDPTIKPAAPTLATNSNAVRLNSKPRAKAKANRKKRR